MAMVTLSEVARHAGVSLATASRVLNGSARTPAPDIADRVRAAATALGYVPNAQAQALARASTSLIGLVVHDIADEYFASIAKGVQRVAADRDRQLLLAVAGSIHSAAPEVERAVTAFAAHRTDAIILAGSRTAATDAVRSRLEAYQLRGGRVVTVGQSWVPGAAAVRIANREGMAELVGALAADGQRRFAYLTGPDAALATVDDRLAGYLDGIVATGAESVALIRGEFSMAGGHECGQRLLEEVSSTRRRPVTVLAGNDVMGLGAASAFSEAGLRIGTDIRVAGFDDIGVLTHLSPGLTTYRLPLGEIGALAAELAMNPELPDPDPVTGTVIRRASA